MRRLLNLLITFLVFWLGSRYFPHYISTNGIPTDIFAAVLMTVAGAVLGWLFIISVLLIPFGIGCITSILVFLVALVAIPIELILLNQYLPSFHIHDVGTYVVLTVLLTIFTSVGTNTSKES